MANNDSPLRRFTDLPTANAPQYTDAELAGLKASEYNPATRGFESAIGGMLANHTLGNALGAELAGDTERHNALLRAGLADQAAAQATGPRVSSLRDVDSVGSALELGMGLMGQGAGSMLPTILVAALTRGRLRVPATLGAAYNLEADEAIGNQYADPTLAKASAEDRINAARMKGILNAGLEAAAPLALVGKAAHAGGIASRVGRTMLEEGATEAAQEAVGFGAEKYLDHDRQLDPVRLADAALAGALGGGGVSAVVNTPAAIADTIRKRRQAAPVQEQGPAAEPPVDAAPPGTPPPPAPDDGSGGGMGGLFDTLNERFAPGLREQAQKTKDYVSDTIDRMGEAAKTAQTPSDFLRQVFGSSTEDAAAADLRHDTEDPGVMNAADPAAALQQRDAERQERAASFAAELLNDPATPDAVKERVSSFGGDFTNPEAQAFVARNLVSQRAGEKLVNAVNGLIDLSKDFGGKAAEVGTDLAAKARGMIDKGMSAAADRIVKKNLQDATPAEQAEFNKLIFDSLTDEAKASPAVRQRLPELANAMLAFAARTGDLTKADLKTLSRMQDGLAMFRDPEQLAAKLTKYVGLPRTEDSFLSRVKRVTNAQQDILQPNSFLYSSLSEDAKDSLSHPQLRQLARLVDDFTLSDQNKAQGDKVLAGLTAAFGSKEAAQSVLDYYQKQNRADLRFDPTRPTKDAYEGTDDVAEYGTLPERDAPVQDTYYSDAKSMRPFYEGREGRLSTEGGTRRRVRDIEAFMDRMQGRGVKLRSQRYGDFLKERNEDSAEAVKRIRKDLEKRITEAAPRKGEAAEFAEGRKKNRQYLEEQLLALNLIEKADGPEAAANLFSVARAVGERNELGITDAQLAKADTLLRRTIDPKKPPRDMTRRQAEKHNRDIAKTKLVFNRTDGAQPLVLSAESLWKAYAKGQPAGRSVRQLFADAVSAVLNRPDVAGLAGGLDGVLIDRASGTYAEPQASAEVLAAKKELAHEYKARLSEAEGRVGAVTSEIEDARDEGPADSELVERIEAAADELQREADSGRIAATALKDKAKAMRWVDGAPSPEAIELRARAAWEHDISRVSAEGARDLRETATEVRSELDRVEDGSNDAHFGNEFRRLERRRADLQRAYDVAHDSGNEAAIKDAKRRLDAVEEAIKRMEALEAKERAYGSAGRTASEERGAAAKVRNYDESTGAALHPDDKPSAAKPEGLGKRLDAALLANPELLEVLDARGQPKDKALTESRMRERLFKAYSAVKTPALKARLEGLRAKYQEAKNASNVGTPAAREAAKQEAAVLKEIGQMVRWILEQREGSHADIEPAHKREDAMARIAALPGTVERTVDGTRVLYVKDADATKYIAGTRNEAVYVNLGRLRADGLVKHLTEGPSAAQKQAVFDALGITAQSLDAVLGNDKRRAAFLRDHELSHIRNGDEATYPRGSDGKPDLMHPDAIAIESRAVRDALSKEELAALGVSEASTGKKEAPSRVILPQISRYAAKDQAKSDRANKFIGRGSPGSSTAAYAEAWGDRANVGEYSPEDTVFISVNGNRPGALSPPWPEIKKAMTGGATLITDVPADRARSSNSGERAVADFLDDNGHFEESPGTWVRGYDIDNATGQKRYAPLGMGEASAEKKGAKAEPKPKTISEAAVNALYDIAVKENYDRLDTPEKVLRYAAMARALMDQLAQIPEDSRTDQQQELLSKLRDDFKQDGHAAFDWDMLFDGMKPTDEQRALLEDIVAKKSAMGAKKGRPGKNWGDKDAVKAEILRLRGKDVRVKIKKLVRDLGGSGQYSYDPATGERLIEVAINATSPLGTARHEAIHDLFRFLSENDATRSVAKDLRDATSAPHVIRQLRELLKGHKAALEQLNDPEERAAYAYQFWAEGLLQIGPTGTGLFHTIRQFLKDLFGVVTAGQRGEDLLRAFHDGKFADPSIVQEVLQDINDRSGDRVANKLNRAAPALTRALTSLFSAAPERLRRFENDYLNELADKFQPEKGTGFVQNKFQQEGVWTNHLGGILRGTTAVERREAIDQLQAMKPTSKLAKELAKFNEGIYEYMRDAGVQSWDSAAKKFVPLRKVQGYFTRSWDPDAIARNRSEFEALLRTEGGVSAKSAAALVENLVRGSEQRPKPKESPVDLGFMPYAPHTSERVLTFINPGNADKFAKFQRKDLADIMTSYVRGSTHRAEYAREFGNNGEKIVDLVTKSGVKDPKELGEISNAVQALEGSLDPGNWSVQTKEAMSAVLTLQNVTLLPLAIVSQMVDPIVLAARTGDIKDAGTAYVTALKRLKNTIAGGKNEVPGEELAEILGVVSEDSTLQAMSMAYGTTRMSKRMENINRVFFKYNGMQGWNNSMRIAATAAGEKYLLAHKGDAKALAELGLEPKYVKVDKNGRLNVSSPKVQQAMFQFVDQAVLRPSAANRPVWMSDPRFLLVAHLKQFTYAMHNVVLKRASRELADDNPKPWGILMLTMPVILAADMAKFALTGTGQSTWGFKDYLVHAVERSGLLGLGDFGVQATRGVDMGKMPGEGLLGPSFENLMEILRWIGGDPRTGLGDVIDRTVPGARFI